jgi:hypothetical protein
MPCLQYQDPVEGTIGKWVATMAWRRKTRSRWLGTAWPLTRVMQERWEISVFFTTMAKGVAQDYEKAMVWYRKALGNEDAKKCLAALGVQ